MTHSPDRSQPSEKSGTVVPAQVAQSHVRLRLLAAVSIVLGIVGTVWIIADQQGFSTIGQGGINAKLLPEVGEIAPEIITFDTSGNMIRLSDFRGQPVWLNFWGSWCPPCRAEFPEIQAAYEVLNAQGLVMLGIAVREDPITAKNYADRVGGTFPVLASPDYLAALIPENEPAALAAAQDIATSYQINNFPTHIFIDRDGTVSAVVISPMTYDDAIAYGQAILESPMPEDMMGSPLVATPAIPVRTDDDE